MHFLPKNLRLLFIFVTFSIAPLIGLIRLLVEIPCLVTFFLILSSKEVLEKLLTIESSSRSSLSSLFSLFSQASPTSALFSGLFPLNLSF